MNEQEKNSGAAGLATALGCSVLSGILLDTHCYWTGAFVGLIALTFWVSVIGLCLSSDP